MKADPAILYSAQATLNGAPRLFCDTVRDQYLENARWSAPVRGVTYLGREVVMAHLVKEAAAMRGAEFTRLRCSANEAQCIDEYAVLFTYTGEGITSAPISAGDLVELKRVRILDLLGGKVATETCIETWSVLAPA